MPDLTAHDLYEIVKGLPEEARPEADFGHEIEPRLEYVPTTSETGPHWVWTAVAKDGPRKGERVFWCGCVNPWKAHEASVMRWLVAREHSLSVYAPNMYDGSDSWTICLYDVPEATGPSLLHALVAAAEGVG